MGADQAISSKDVAYIGVLDLEEKATAEEVNLAICHIMKADGSDVKVFGPFSSGRGTKKRQSSCRGKCGTSGRAGTSGRGPGELQSPA